MSPRQSFTVQPKLSNQKRVLPKTLNYSMKNQWFWTLLQQQLFHLQPVNVRSSVTTTTSSQVIRSVPPKSVKYLVQLVSANRMQNNHPTVVQPWHHLLSPPRSSQNYLANVLGRANTTIVRQNWGVFLCHSGEKKNWSPLNIISGYRRIEQLQSELKTLYEKLDQLVIQAAQGSESASFSPKNESSPCTATHQRSVKGSMVREELEDGDCHQPWLSVLTRQRINPILAPSPLRGCKCTRCELSLQEEITKNQGYPEVFDLLTK